MQHAAPSSSSFAGPSGLPAGFSGQGGGYMPYQPGISGGSSSSSSSSPFVQTSTPGGGGPRKRSTSPVKAHPPPFGALPGLGLGAGSSSGPGTGSGAGAGVADDDTRPIKFQRAEELYNQRAEEEVARRLNAGRTYYAQGPRDQQGKLSDLFGRAYLRDRIGRLTKDMNTSFDEETLAYLSQAAEQRIRGLLTSAIRAQIHRTQTSHHRPPPFAPRPPGAGAGAGEEDEDGRPMWSHVITSDVNAVMDALTRRTKEAEQEFRASRMDRIVKENEMARLREAREARAREEGMSGEAEGVGSIADVDMGEQDRGSGAGGGGSAGPSTPRAGPSAAVTAHTGAPDTPAPNPSTPVFGAVRERTTTGKKTGTSKSKEQSAETSLKMTNAAAAAAAGTKLGKYSWLSSAPNISSPLAGKKKKGMKRDRAAEGAGDVKAEDREGGEAGSSDTEGAGAGTGGAPAPSKRSKLSESVLASDSPLPSPLTPNPRGVKTKSKKKKPPANSVPSRRLVPIMPPPPAAAAYGSVPPTPSERRLLPDDKVLTAVDLLFALEREGGGHGVGSLDEVVWKVQSRIGGAWGKEGWAAPLREGQAPQALASPLPGQSRIG